MTLDDYQRMARLTKHELTEPCSSDDEKMQMLYVADMAHKEKCNLLEELALDAISAWLIDKGVGHHLAAVILASAAPAATQAPSADPPPAPAAPALDAAAVKAILRESSAATLRDAVIQCFKPGNAPIPEVRNATKTGFWAGIGKSLKI